MSPVLTNKTGGDGSLQAALLTKAQGFEVDSHVFSSCTGKLRKEQHTLHAVACVCLSQFGLLHLRVALAHPTLCVLVLCPLLSPLSLEQGRNRLFALLKELPSICGTLAKGRILDLHIKCFTSSLDSSHLILGAGNPRI